MGETLGYLTAEIRKRCPRAKLIVIYYHSDFISREKPVAFPHWNPQGGISLSQFLHSNLSDLDMLGLSLVSWPGADKVFPDISRHCTEEVGRFIRERSGSLTTTGGFGNRWIKNAFLNFLQLPNLVPLPLHLRESPLIIAASGPSLAESLALLKTYRNRFTLWALPSSVEALLSADIVPDLIIQTDPGFYATHHLRPLLNTSLPLAMPLTSVRGLWKSRGPVFLFSQGSMIENLLMSKTDKVLPRIPATGTVAAAALVLAQSVKPPAIITVGLDLCSRDLHNHIRPHGFEPILHLHDGRFKPYLGTLYRRTMLNSRKVEGGMQSNPLRTYAEWLGPAFSDSAVPIYRLNPSSIKISSFKPLGLKAGMHLLQSLPLPRPSELIYPSDPLPLRRDILASEILKEWKVLLHHQRLSPSDSSEYPLFSSPLAEELITSFALAELLTFLKKSIIPGTPDFCDGFNLLIETTIRSITSLERELAL